MKKFLICALACCMLFCFVGCDFWGEESEIVIDPNAIPPETIEELYSYYNQIERGMTKADVEALFGEGELHYDDGMPTFTSYKNEKKSAGVNVIYAAGDKVSAKILYYNKAEDLVKFSSSFDPDKISQISEKDPVSKAEELFGKALEIGYEYDANTLTGYSKILSWFNEDGSNLQIHTDNEIIEQIIYCVAPDKR